MSENEEWDDSRHDRSGELEVRADPDGAGDGSGLGPVMPDLEPEVAGFVDHLRGLFLELDESPRRYAARIWTSTSMVCQSLNGERIASRDFVDGLLDQGEIRRGGPVTDEVRRHLRGLQLDALRVRSPLEHEAQCLADRLHDAIVRLDQDKLHIRALVEAVASRERRIRELDAGKRELAQAWAADRGESEATLAEFRDQQDWFLEECEALRGEVAKLEEDLRRVEALRKQSEDYCAELEEKLAKVETKMEQLEREVVRQLDAAPARSAQAEAELASLVAESEAQVRQVLQTARVQVELLLADAEKKAKETKAEAEKQAKATTDDARRELERIKWQLELSNSRLKNAEPGR